MTSRGNLDNLAAFVAVARERSFTKAAAQLGVSQSALSHTIGALEARIGIRLLTRTTRSVSPTEAGERLLQNIGPRLQEIETELSNLSELRDKPSGTIRVSAGEHSALTIVWPALVELLPKYPDVKVEVIVDNGLVDIVADRFDAGVRLSEQVAKDMIAVRIGPELRMGCAAAPAYLADRKRPKVPQDLTDHQCVNMRLPTYGGVYAWEFEKGGRQIKVRVDGQCTFNNLAMRLSAGLAGIGIVYMPDDVLEPYVASGHLVRLLADWSPKYSGYHLYYPSRRQTAPAFALLVDALRHRR
ncbi:LysR family transcriptional regulator [soil metagenome]